MLISYLLSLIHTDAHTHNHKQRFAKKTSTKRVKVVLLSVRQRKKRRVRGHWKETLKRPTGENLSRLSDEVSDVVKEEKRGCFISISLSVYDMSRKGEHIKCMTHKCVCLCAPPTPYREGLHPLLQEG